MKRLAALALALLAGPVLAQQAPASQRLEAALSTHVISQVNRSTDFARTMPPPQVRERPPVEEPWMVRLADGLYAERSLVPERAKQADREDAIRVLRERAR